MNKPLMPSLKPIGEAPEPTKAPVKLTKIVEYGNGYLIALGDDGKKYKRSGGSLSWRNHNPGNVKWGDFAKKYGALGSGFRGHAVFPDKKTGLEAQKALLFSSIRGYNKLSIRDAIAKYAPVGDGNKPRQYAIFVAGKTGVSTTTKLNELSEARKVKLIEAMTEYEGFKVGTVTEV